MRRLLALGVLATLALAACALFLWPRDQLRKDAASTKDLPKIAVPSPRVSESRSVPALSKVDDTHPATWAEFIAACKRKDFSTANKLAVAATAAAIDGCADLLALPREFSWDVEEARALREVAVTVFSGHDEPGTMRIRQTALLEYVRCWPVITALDATRQRHVASEVAAKPIDVSDRAALLPGDWLFVDTVRLGESSRAKELRALFEKAAKHEQNERPYYEPLLSALIRLHADDAKLEAQQIARDFVNQPSLSERLRWELRVLALANGTNLTSFLKAVEPRTSRIGPALRDALKDGLTVEELLRIVIPYLESRFGAGEARGDLIGAVASWIRNGSAGQFEMFVSGASVCFLDADPGTSLATVYLNMLNIGCVRRDIDQTGRALIEGVPEGARIKSVLPAEHAGAVREAIIRHRERSMEAAKDTELPQSPLAELCTIIVESCSSLSEAISDLERLVGSKRPIESDGLRQGFATVLMRCRALLRTNSTTIGCCANGWFELLRAFCWCQKKGTLRLTPSSVPQNWLDCFFWLTRCSPFAASRPKHR